MLYGAQEIRPQEDDSNTFIKLVNQIISTMVFQYGIKELHYTKIKNWFDHKWLNYSGKAVIYFESNEVLPVDASLENKWQNKITVPPFHPNRVLMEFWVKKQATGNKRITKTLHPLKSSNDNLHNRISDYSKNGLFVWYSSNSKENNKGSLMVYRVQEDEIHTFYASLENNGDWKITQTKGIGLNELKMYISESRP